MEVSRIKSTLSGQVKSQEPFSKESIQFQSVMNRERSVITYDRLTKKVNEIEKQGKMLTENQTVDNLRKYKKMVRDFLKEVVDNGLELSENFSFNHRGSTRTHRIVKEVDKKLIDLTNEVLEKEKVGLNIADLVGEIKGILINIYT
ncbi:YaaR family protein [Robertmurraya massiliosenegalensis]|uniref:YaaR family protein n=1 Tax=Robertmurraya massiliosenegalensis TaxID=1287657 RepID=UPI00030F33AA|nr:YaaR family protein [Robertmurraya massiliosenegalensis]